jgi:peptide/nickel transport system ATP-binding protein
MNQHGPGRRGVDDGELLLETRDLTVEETGDRARPIVSNVSLEVRAGEAIALVGESGSGKSLTAKAIVGLLPRGLAARGRVNYRGVDLLQLDANHRSQFRGSHISMILQDPYTMLNPLLRAGGHIEEMIGPARSSDKSARRREMLRRLKEVGISDSEISDQYPFQLSGGMQQRVGLAAALGADCDLLIADEPSTALDVTTQKEVLLLLKSFQKSRRMGLILITHNLQVAFAVCDRVYVLYGGSVLEAGSTLDVRADPLHPYTLGLLLSEPPIDRQLDRLATIPGSVPTAESVKTVCPFSSRCAWAESICTSGKPPLREVASRHYSACVRVGEIHGEMVQSRTLAVSPSLPRVAMSPQALEVTDLRRAFTGARRVTAVDGVSFSVRQGESVGIVGESGSGKTTLARCIVGLDRPTEGSVSIAGMGSLASGLREREHRRAIQMVFQNPFASLNPSHSVGFVLREALSLMDPRANDLDEAIRGWLKRVGLDERYMRRRPAELSGGERQRVAIARAVSLQPKILVCDEPTSALDLSVQAQILNLFKSLQVELGTTYLFITHDLAVARQVCDRILVMHDGKIVESGSTIRVLDYPEHPYTKRLVESVPRAEPGWLNAARAIPS